MMSTDAAMHSALKIREGKVQFEKVLIIVCLKSQHGLSAASQIEKITTKKSIRLALHNIFSTIFRAVWNRWDLARYKPPSHLIFWDKNILNCRFDNSIIGSI